ncbi:Putative C2 domain, phosphatidylinositol-specific phospholipase C, X domain, C2 domain superfamily [Septoria linicola]|uniref:Phosphoinositide phospholipase C n=1 Tax=Septoria linicola TaxID=215465 RepID=A0A9Q9AQ18_9PEZI|nr:Putative C2 domain, phosphatidylinositol-specific phospholipase C, X domain, C2 domain superfamily [Septoria linicola]
MAAFLTSAVAKLNPFAKQERDEDDFGEAVEVDSVAGGGHASRVSKITKEQLRVSHALKTFLINNHILGPQEVNLNVRDAENSGALKEMLDNPHVHVPREVTSRGHPLTEYFISSSHNTYLLAHQLYGSSSAVAYETALSAGSRCVEIDAWDNSDHPDEPKVTHGWTLASRVSFRAVCETIRDVVDKEATQPQETGYAPTPVLISLENHCGNHGQLRLVQIMREVWGDRLLSKAVRDEGKREQTETGEHVDLTELGSKIAVIVEYHLPDEAESDSSDDEDEDEQSRIDHEKWRKDKNQCAQGIIIPELAELGVYAQSVKPANNSWFESVLQDGPPHHLINVSESGLLGLDLELNGPKIGTHNSQHLMRVYPKGTRISSKNLNPVPFWGVGAQICALNWQKFDASMQLNEALFAGTDGYVLKPAALRAGGSGKLDSGKKKHLRMHVAGATDVPIPKDRDPEDEIKPYVTCTLVHPDDVGNTPPKRKTSAYKQHKLGIVHRGEQPPPTDPIWDEQLDWDFEENELVFLRILIKSDDKFARNPVQCVAAVRLSYVRSGEWVFVRMLNLKGKETHCTVLVKFEITDA